MRPLKHLLAFAIFTHSSSVVLNYALDMGPRLYLPDWEGCMQGRVKVNVLDLEKGVVVLVDGYVG